MQFKFDPRTGTMVPKENPRKELEKSIRRTDSTITFTKCRFLREGLAILSTDEDGMYLAVKLNGQWRMCGYISNYNNIVRASRGPITDFHNVWLTGTKISNPRDLVEDIEED